MTNFQFPITHYQTEAIKVSNLHKHYGKLAAVKGINFTVNKGEMFGLIGPDGAGKTTSFHILGGVMEATAGEVLVYGQPARDARLITGYLTQQFSLYLDLSIDENLRYAGGLRQVPDDLLWERRHKYLTLMSLERFGDRLAGELSGGMKQKLALCCALVSQPEVLLLDEPTTGVDPVSRREFWDVLAELSAEGMTIVVATPYLDEAERCHRVALMYSGQIHEIGTPAALRANLGLHRLEVKTANLEMSEQILLQNLHTNIVDVQTFGDRLDVLVEDITIGENQVNELLKPHHPTIEHGEPTLENVFVTRLRQQGSAPPFLQFPRSRGGNRKEGDREQVTGDRGNRKEGDREQVTGDRGNRKEGDREQVTGDRGNRKEGDREQVTGDRGNRKEGDREQVTGDRGNRKEGDREQVTGDRGNRKEGDREQVTGDRGNRKEGDREQVTGDRGNRKEGDREQVTGDRGNRKEGDREQVTGDRGNRKEGDREQVTGDRGNRKEGDREQVTGDRGNRKEGDREEIIENSSKLSPVTYHLSPSSSIAIYANNLNRVFGKFQAVKSVNIEVRYGEIFGLLGANGAGKTTTIKMLCGLLAASGGEISLGGETGNLRSAKLRKRIGYMSQKFTLYDDLTILQNLEFYSGVYSVPRKLRRDKINWVISTCGLEGQENMLTGQLPGGWKQRVAFGASVMHEPDILFLDEPTSGVDPLARRQFWKLINDFARNGTAILVTTHYLEEAEQCNRMSFMVAGEIAAEGSPSYIKDSQPGKLIEIIVNQNQAASKLLKQQFDSWRVSIFANSLHIVLDNPEIEIPQVMQLLKSENFTVESLRPIPFSLEDAFIGIVQRTGNN